jgi:radical SAM protein with 4Fe4S-binding SPASM domain
MSFPKKIIRPAKKKTEKNFDKACAVPWMHLAFEPDGKVIPCCLTSTHEDAFVGDLNEQSVEEIWNSPRMKSLRKDMINGIEPKICNKCFDQEKVTGESGRVHHNRQFPEVVKNIPNITEEDGTCKELKLRYWDFRFSNLCNYKCRSCGPTYSSTWVPDAKKLGWITEQDKVLNIESVNDKTNFDFLKDQVQHVEKIYFAGGEPLLMDEHWQILDMLVKNKKFDVRLSYNTNCSILTYGKKNILDYWKQWQDGKIEVWPSIDEIDERAELIRSGTVWRKVEENLKELTKLNNIILRPGLTIGAWNVNRLPEIITRLIELGVIRSKKEFGCHYNNFFINMLMEPTHYHVSILPDSYREETINKLENFIKDFDAKHESKIARRFTYILHELTKPFNREAAENFIKITNKLDKLRDEDTFATIPEMNIVKEAWLKKLG